VEAIKPPLCGDGYCVGIGIRLLFESATDPEAVNVRHHENPRTSVPPTWASQTDAAEDWAYMVTFNRRLQSDRVLARSVLHPVSLHSPRWRSPRVGDALTLKLDGTPVGHGSVKWLAELPLGIPPGTLADFVAWSLAVNRPEIED
jgi:hypothetical protein